MYLFSVKLPIIKENDPLLETIVKSIKKIGESLKNGDIIVISEKVIATSQGRIKNLSEVREVTEKAKDLAKSYEMDERFVELILQEASMVVGGMRSVILTKVNDFLIANSGIDQSNAGEGRVVLLPSNLKEVVKEYRNKLKKIFSIDDLGVIIADSRVQPLRRGTIGIAIAIAGFEPVEDLRGRPDLFGRPLEITMRAIADDLTSAAQFMLSESNEQTPVAIIRGAKVEFTENPQMIMEMPPEECLYMNIFSKYLIEKKDL